MDNLKLINMGDVVAEQIKYPLVSVYRIWENYHCSRRPRRRKDNHDARNCGGIN